jgi:hypothetical protein
MTWLVGMLDDLTQWARLRVGADLMMFRKSIHTVEGVVHDLGGSRAEIDDTLLKECILEFGRELPERWFAWPHSRVFVTRLSTFDITAAIFNFPLALARLLREQWSDALAG